MIKHGAALLMIVALVSCGPRPEEAAPPMAEKSAVATDALMNGDARVTNEAAPPADAPAPPPPPGQPSAPGVTAPLGAVMLAYAYQTGIEVPAKAVSATIKAHEDKCVKAGPALCQVLGSSTNSYGEDDVRAELQLRAEPRWLKTFRDDLASDAEKAGGKIKSTSVTSEDLTRDITDTEARLRAARTLRDRLQNLLASRPGKLSDLLDVERELARVQGDIDSTESNLAVMRARVSMSTLTLEYTSAGSAVTDRTFEPIVEALRNFMHIVSTVIGALIVILAGLLPLVPVGWGLWWLFKKWRNRKRKTEAETAPT
jgi:hypothetical protein